METATRGEITNPLWDSKDTSVLRGWPSGIWFWLSPLSWVAKFEQTIHQSEPERWFSSESDWAWVYKKEKRSTSLLGGSFMIHAEHASLFTTFWEVPSRVCVVLLGHLGELKNQCTPLSRSNQIHTLNFALETVKCLYGRSTTTTGQYYNKVPFKIKWNMTNAFPRQVKHSILPDIHIKATWLNTLSFLSSWFLASFSRVSQGSELKRPPHTSFLMSTLSPELDKTPLRHLF